MTRRTWIVLAFVIWAAGVLALGMVVVAGLPLVGGIAPLLAFLAGLACLIIGLNTQAPTAAAPDVEQDTAPEQAQTPAETASRGGTPMRSIGRIFWTLVWLAALAIAGAIILSLAASRVGEHKASTFGQAYTRFQESWGGEIGIQPPTFSLERTWEERVYNAEAKAYEMRPRKETIALVPEEIDIEADVHYGVQRVGLLSFNAFEACIQETYCIPNSTTYNGTLLLNLAKPENANFMYDYAITLRDGEDKVLRPDLGTPLRLVTDVDPAQIEQVQVSYSTKGMDVFRYRLSAYQNNVVQRLHARIKLDTSLFEVYRFGMPHTIETTDAGATVTFDMQDFATTQDLGVAFDSRQAYLDQIQSLMQYSPISLLLWIVVILLFAQVKGLRFNPLHYLFIVSLQVFYFLFVAYLIRFFGVWLSFGIATALTAIMFVVYCPNVLGWRFAGHIAAIYLFLLTVVYSAVFLMPIFRGLLFVTLCFLIFMSVMIAVSRSEINRWPLLSDK